MIDFRILVVTIFGTLLLFNAFGFDTPTTGFFYNIMISNDTTVNSGEPIINYSSNNMSSGLSNPEGTTVWNKLFVLTMIAVIATVVSGFITKTSGIEYISASFIILIATYVVIDMVALLTIFWSYGSPWSLLGTLIIAPLIVLLILTAYEYWRAP